MDNVQVPMNDLSRRWYARSPDARALIDNVLSSGWYVQGRHHAALEQEFAQFMGADHAVGVASGTDALELAMRAVGCSRNSTVLMCANAGGYASIAAARIGAGAVYVDIDPVTHTMSPDCLKEVIHEDDGAVVVTHLYGNVADVPRIRDICERFEVPLIEDCAQATGASLKGRRVGTFGSAGCFSFYPTKNLGGIGDGGAITTSSRDLDSAVRRLRQYGWSTRYRVDQEGGMNSRLDEVQAALLRPGLQLLDRDNENRRRIVRTYQSATRESEIIRMVSGSSDSFVGHLAVVECADTNTRDQARRWLADKGVQTDIHYPIPDHEQPRLPAPVRAVPLPVTESVVGRIFSVPCFAELTERETTTVGDALSSFSVPGS